LANSEINIYGDIVPFKISDEFEYDLHSLNADLKSLTISENETLTINIHTCGGDVETGFGIYNILQRFKKENKINLITRIDGYCASIGTVIFLAGDKRIGNEFNSPFVHDAWTISAGNGKELIKIGNELEAVNNRIAKLYSERTNLDFEKAKDLMANETWISPQDALEYNFYTEIENNVNARLILNSIKNNIKTNNMNINEQIKAIYNKLFVEVKNKIVYDANNVEVDFYELADTEVVKVGDKARIGSDNANGEVLMASSDTYVFENGVLTEIKKMEEENTDEIIAQLKAEIEELKSKNSNLETSNNSLKDENAKFLEFKNQVLNIKQDAPKDEKKQHEKVVEEKKEKKFILNKYKK